MFKNLQAEMIREGLTNENIAEALNLTPHTVRRKMNGEIGITISEAKIIKSLFKKTDFTIDFLFQEDNELAEVKSY